MQSGIKASTELHTAFNKFTSDPSLFCIPVTIDSESLQPLDPIPFSSSELSFSLSSLEPHVKPKTPIYLLIRTSQQNSDLTAVTYVPSIAPVRSKTLFASTRSTLIRELGIEKFTSNLFCTDAEEILDPKQWTERAKADSLTDAGLLSREEHELGEIKRAEQEERHGTSGRDLMGSSGAGTSSGSSWGSGLRMKATDEATTHIRNLVPTDDSGCSSGSLLVLGIDLPTELITFISSHLNIPPDEVSSHIPKTQPSYSFYHYPSTFTTIFIYTCPMSSKIKEKMIYASAKREVLNLASHEDVEVSKRIEAGEAADVDGIRIREELGLDTQESSSSNGRGGFARPKRPGKR